MNRFTIWAQENYKALLIAALCFTAFIFFEARQQMFYMENFNNGIPVSESFWDILKSGTYRWLIWVGLSIPMILILLKYRMKEINGKGLLISAGLILGVLILNLAVVTALHIWRNGSSLSAFQELFEFYFYHKAPIILAASTFLVVLLNFFLSQEALQLKIQELGSLKYSDERLYQSEKKDLDDQEMVIQVKVGHRLKLVPISSINWIEADDYCVKIHDHSGNSFTMRSSLKAFEQKLPEHTFGRVHRKAIVNFTRVKELDMTNAPEAILEDGTRVPVAQARVKQLRQSFLTA